MRRRARRQHLSACQRRGRAAARAARRRPRCGVAAQCVGVLAVALRGAWRPYAAALVEPMILTGLSPTLVQALQARRAARSQAAVLAAACFGRRPFPKIMKGVVALPACFGGGAACEWLQGRRLFFQCVTFWYVAEARSRVDMGGDPLRVPGRPEHAERGQRARARAQAIVGALPDLLGPVQVQLLDLLSLVLARRPHRDSLSQAQLHALSQALLLGARPAPSAARRPVPAPPVWSTPVRPWMQRASAQPLTACPGRRHQPILFTSCA